MCLSDEIPVFDAPCFAVGLQSYIIVMLSIWDIACETEASLFVKVHWHPVAPSYALYLRQTASTPHCYTTEANSCVLC